jgi:hypothetical protein
MASDVPEHHSDGSMSTEVDALDGKRYEVRVWAIPEGSWDPTPVRGLRGRLIKLAGGAVERERFRVFVYPAGGGPVLGAKLLAGPALDDALLECSRMVSRSGLDEFDDVHFGYGDGAG